MSHNLFHNLIKLHVKGSGVQVLCCSFPVEIDLLELGCIISQVKAGHQLTEYIKLKSRIYPLCLIFIISVLSFLITDIH